MRFTHILTSQWLLPAALSFPSAVSTTSRCKTIPSSADWPSDAQWSKLNSSLSGALLAPSAPGAVCHPNQPTFDKVLCARVSKEWTSSSYHSSIPLSLDYNDDTCFPNASVPCSAQGYPIYVVNASSALHVKNAVDFAREHDIRLTVKGTGHDFNGRSSAPYSLSIWTHYLKDTNFYSTFTPRACPGCDNAAAVRVGAGMQWHDIQKEAGRHGVMVVSGGDGDVGVGGFISGGGHSPISSQFGMAADQVLEFEVVTAAGHILTVNECNHKDLFWALRGGGPSFAILLSATVKTYPTAAVTMYKFAINTTGDSETFWQTNAYFHSQLPDFSDKGFMGYYFGYGEYPGEKNKAIQGKVLGYFTLLNGTAAEAEEIFEPLKQYFHDDPFPDKVHVNTYTTHYPTFNEMFLTTAQPQAVGLDGRLGSRLLGRHALTSNRTALAQAIKTASRGGILLGHVVAGKGVRDAKPAGGSDAVNPAWRRAYTHMIIPVSWPLLDEEAKQRITHQLTYEKIAALRDVAPDMGAYVNEADPDEPNWQLAFWGEHYGRLSEIKEKWDPSGVFYCFPCVGAEKWKMVDDRLCRA